LPGESLDPTAAAVAKEGSFYTPIAGSRESGFKARPVLYGMKLAGLFAGGRMRAAAFDTVQPGATAYAADLDGGGTRVVVINKDASSDLPVRIAANGAVKVWRLEAASLTATADVTLAGSFIEAWKPSHEEKIESREGFVTVQVKAASALVLFAESRIV
jgi:hypothetical protein